jgi:hypothetical protein
MGVAPLGLAAMGMTELRHLHRFAINDLYSKNCSREVPEAEARNLCLSGQRTLIASKANAINVCDRIPSEPRERHP